MTDSTKVPIIILFTDRDLQSRPHTVRESKHFGTSYLTNFKSIWVEFLSASAQVGLMNLMHVLLRLILK